MQTGQSAILASRLKHKSTRSKALTNFKWGKWVHFDERIIIFLYAATSTIGIIEEYSINQNSSFWSTARWCSSFITSHLNWLGFLGSVTSKSWTHYTGTPLAVFLFGDYLLLLLWEIHRSPLDCQMKVAHVIVRVPIQCLVEQVSKS